MSSKRDVFEPLEGPEYHCAVAIITNGGFARDEFVLEQRCSVVRQPLGYSRIYKLINVKRVTVGFLRQYNCGPGGGWPYEFERDLRTLVFGLMGHSVTPTSARAQIWDDREASKSYLRR